MAKGSFDNAAGNKIINDYIITLTEKSSLPYVRLGIIAWVTQQTGCIPAIEVINQSDPSPRPELFIQCTEGLITKIRTQFGSDIAKVENAPRLSDIPPSRRKCWKPKGVVK